MNMADMKKGGRYNWRNQPERLVYIGHNWSGNGYWHQFEKVDEPGVVWCEVTSLDLVMFEETPQADFVQLESEQAGVRCGELRVIGAGAERGKSSLALDQFDFAQFDPEPLALSFGVGKRKAQWKQEVNRGGRR